MPIPSGAVYVPGRKSVMLASGERVTRQHALNMFAQSVGARNDYELRRAYRQAGNVTNSPTYKRDLARARDNGVPAKEFKGMATVLSAEQRTSTGRDRRSDARQTKGAVTDRSPDSPLARYLTAIGRRSSAADYAVGETPSTYN